MAGEMWEYAVLRLDESPGAGPLVPHYVNGEEVPGWPNRSVPLHVAINELGAQGWELVGVYEEIGSLIFKRSRQS